MRVVGYMRTSSCLIGEDMPEKTLEIQKKHMDAYAGKMGVEIEKYYCDDTDEDSAFDRLLRDGMARKFDLVLVNSLFRCGSSLWKAREVLGRTLFPAGIHFAVAEDDFCSVGKGMDEVDAFFEKKYGWYKEQNLKRKVMKRSRKGILAWSDAKYGYDLDEKGQLVVNEETAPVVRRIFELYAGGMDMKEIAGILKSEKIPTPKAMRKAGVKMTGNSEKEDRKDEEPLPCNWLRNSVKEILGRSVYCGSWTKTVQGEELCFTNEPIISEELYEATWKRLEAQTRDYRPQKKKNRYHKILVDREHGFVFRFRENKDGELYCAYQTAELAAGCEKKQLLAKEIDRAVTRALRMEHKKALEVRRKMETSGAMLLEKQTAEIRDKLREQAALLARSEKEKMAAYGKMGREELSKEAYEKVREEAENIRNLVEDEFRNREEELEKKRIALSVENPWMKLFLDWKEIPEGLEENEVTREILEKYVERIEIEQLCINRVVLKEEAWFMELPEEWRESESSEKVKIQ